MATKEKELNKLSDAELDSLIEHGINQQETVKRHGHEYQHHMNVVAAAKQEKARRQVNGVSDEQATINPAITDKVEDKYTEENPLSSNGAEHLSITPDAGKKEIKAAKKATAPKSAKKNPTVPDPDKVNKGIPGVEPQQAETTPENQNG